MTTAGSLLQRIKNGSRRRGRHDTDYTYWNTPNGCTVEICDPDWNLISQTNPPYPTSTRYEYWQRCRYQSHDPRARPDLWEVSGTGKDYSRDTSVTLEDPTTGESITWDPHGGPFKKVDLTTIDVDWSQQKYPTEYWWAYDDETEKLARGRSHSAHAAMSQQGFINWVSRATDRAGYHWGNKEIVTNRRYEVIGRLKKEVLEEEMFASPLWSADNIHYVIELLEKSNVLAEDVCFAGQAIFLDRLSAIKLGFSSGDWDIEYPDPDRTHFDYIFPANFLKWDDQAKKLFEFVL